MSEANMTASLIDLLEEAYHRQAWHGTNLRGSIRGLTLDRICWRPAPHRHNIWEIVVHCAYWKYTVRRRLTGEKRGSFPLHGSNWFRRPGERTAAAWNADLRLLESMHRTLITTIGELSDKELIKSVAAKKFTHRQTIQGIALHDVYHAGQIQLLKRLQQK
jgi:hypothetical protein